MTDKIIRGAFFGLFKPPKPPKPFKAPDTLNSKQFATLQDLISEGEIEGFATPSKLGLNRGNSVYNNAALKDVFLNNTPVLNKNASNLNPQPADFNFQDVGFTPRFGTANQAHIPGIEGSESVSNVGVKVTNSASVTRQITNTAVDAAKIVVTFPSLQRFNDEGDIYGTSVNLKIQVQYNGGGFADVINDTVTGRSADAYQKQYRVSFTGAFPIDIRVVRVTGDSSSSQLQNDLIFTSITEVVDDKQTYPNSAYTNLRIDSEQFSAIPDRSYRIRGVKVRIPGASASVVSATYTQSTTVVTVNNNNHGLSVGESVVFTATSGAGVNGTFVIQTVPDVNSFTLTSSTSQTVTTSNCTFAAIPNVDLATGRIRYPNGYIFNGAMSAAQWCSCPALILLDLLTTERYGFGTHIKDANLDLFSFIAASKYANELVNDGFGGQEARFSCNVNIQGSSDAFKLINELAGVMRCFPIWSEGSVFISQDRPTDPTYLFSLANVGEGGFSYSGSSLKQRNTVINVSYFNMDSREIDYEVVEDTAAQAKLGIIKKDIKAFACTSRGQAQRLGKAILFSQQNESEIVTFTTSIDSGAIVRPGSVIIVNDPVRHGARRSGRIKAASTTQITIDNTADLDTFGGANQKCSVIMPDGTVETKNVTGIIGNIITLDSSSPLSTTPNVNTIWYVQSDRIAPDERPHTFRVITVEENDGINFTITALTYIKEKYDNIEKGLSLPPRGVSLLNSLKNPPANLQASERIVVINNLAIPKLILSWVSVTGVSQYLVQYRFNSTNWVSEIVFRPDFEILNTEAGSYEFRVFSYNSGLKLSATSTDLTFNAVGKTKPPSDVENLTIEPINNKLLRLRWKESVDADVIHGGKVYVRHSNKTDGSGTFQNSIDLIEALAGNTTEAIVPSLDGEYILKFRDDQGNFSVGETSVILDLPDLIDSQQILQDREDTDSTPFGGTKTNCSIISGGLQLTDPSANLTGTYDFVSTLDLGAVFSLDLQRLVQAIGFALGGQTITATYVRTTATIGGQSQTVIEITSNGHGRSVDDYINFAALTGGATSGVNRIVAVTTNTFQFLASGNAISSSNCTFAFVNTIDQLIPSGTFWDDYAPNGNFDGPQVNDTSAFLSVRTTSDDPSSSSPTYTQFNTFANGTFKGRGFQFRATLKSENTSHNIALQQLGVIAKFESRTERSYVSGSSTSTAPLTSSSSASGLNVTFGSPFFTGTSSLGGLNAFLPSVGITIVGADAGDYFVLSNVSATGFNIKILDSSNNPVNPAKQFTFQAVGYGKGV